MHKHILITGGSHGVGYEIARAFLNTGAHVVFCGRDPQRVREAEAKLTAHGDVVGIVADVRNRQELSTLIDQALEVFGTIDVLVNNAGVSYYGPFEGQSRESMDEIIDVNVKGMLFATSIALPHIKNHGVIINIASGAGLHGFPNLATYSASKFAVIGFTEALAKELASRNIAVYAVCPGRIALQGVTDSRAGMLPEVLAARILDIVNDRMPAKSGESILI